MSSCVLKMFPKPLVSIMSLPPLPKKEFVLKSSSLFNVITQDTYNHFKYLNESNFTELKYKTLQDVQKHFSNFAPTSNHTNNYSQEIEIIGYSLTEFNVEDLPGILFSKNFEILALKNENKQINENSTQLMLIDIEKLKDENQKFIKNTNGNYLS